MSIYDYHLISDCHLRPISALAAMSNLAINVPYKNGIELDIKEGRKKRGDQNRGKKCTQMKTLCCIKLMFYNYADCKVYNSRY